MIASLEAGLYGTTPAATTAVSLLSSFPQVRFALLVGIGGGIPSAGRDLGLGDIAVSQPSGSIGGVVQYDLIKANGVGQVERKDFLNKPPQVLLKALSNLQAKHKRKNFGIPGILKDMADQNPEMFVSEPGEPGFEFQGVENDRLFDTSYQHVPGTDCSERDVKKILPPADLVHALAARPGDHELNDKNFVFIAEIVSLCAGLVVIDEKSTVVQLVHYTTKEYLTNRSNKNNFLDWVRPQEEELVRSCLTYSTFNTFLHGPCLPQNHECDEYVDYQRV